VLPIFFSSISFGQLLTYSYLCNHYEKNTLFVCIIVMLYDVHDGRTSISRNCPGASAGWQLYYVAFAG